MSGRSSRFATPRRASRSPSQPGNRSTPGIRSRWRNTQMAPLEVLALIPARGGSKGIPRKNLLPLAGKPLIAFSIEQARASRLITRTIVSTDDDEIAAEASRYGAEVPFMRPAEFARDSSTDHEVFRHALEWL